MNHLEMKGEELRIACERWKKEIDSDLRSGFY